MSALKAPPFSRKSLLEVAASFGVLAGDRQRDGERHVARGRRGHLEPRELRYRRRQRLVQTSLRSRPRRLPALYRRWTHGCRACRYASSRVEVTVGNLSDRKSSARKALTYFLSYAGRYDVRGDHVFHHVEVSVFNDLMGTTLERQFKIEGDVLTIRTLPPEIWGSSNILVWKRV